MRTKTGGLSLASLGTIVVSADEGRRRGRETPTPRAPPLGFGAPEDVVRCPVSCLLVHMWPHVSV